MNPCLYIFVNSSLGMSQGKLGAQCGHAAVEAYRLSGGDRDQSALSNGNNLLRHWYKGGHYKKIVLDGGDSLTLLTTQQYLQDRGFRVALVIDEGRTEIAPITPTALGVAVVDKDDPHVEATFSTFDLLRSCKEVEPQRQRRRLLWRRSSKASRKSTMDPSPGS